MLLTGRRLAAKGEYSVWEDRTGETVILQDSGRRSTVVLTVDEARALRDVLVEAFAALEQPEQRKDALRRFQILRARLATLADQARQLPASDGEDDE